MAAYSVEINRFNNLSEDKGNIKEEEKNSFISDLTQRFKTDYKNEGSPKSEPDIDANNFKRNKVKLFKTHSMNVNKSSKIKSENPDIKVDRSVVINNLKIIQRNNEKKNEEVPLRLMDSWEILKQLKTQRRDYTDNIDYFKNMKIVSVEELEEFKSEVNEE